MTTSRDIIQAACDLVQRSRYGDQNAMAMIAQVRVSAAKGSPRAKIAEKAIQDYIKTNPASGNAPVSSIGEDAKEAISLLRSKGPVIGVIALFVLCGEGAEALLAGTIALANGPEIDARRVSAIGATIDDGDDRHAFYCGVKFSDVQKLLESLPEPCHAFVQAGRCIAAAMSIQDVRKPSSSITAFSPGAGWELGE